MAPDEETRKEVRVQQLIQECLGLTMEIGYWNKRRDGEANVFSLTRALTDALYEMQELLSSYLYETAMESINHSRDLMANLLILALKGTEDK